jgi:catechol 2,3-dioxygenase-like lactoylglutathione lyase family enzyme
MKKETEISHVALTYENRKEAEIFFKKILGLELSKSFTLSEKLTNDLFGIKEEIEVDVYSNKSSYFEIFFSNKKKMHFFDHTCIKVSNKEDFIKKCKDYKIDPLFIKKGEKTLLFVRDFAGNLFEIVD